jgi:hypothetical protein
MQNLVNEKSRNSAKLCLIMQYEIPRDFRQFRTEYGRDESTKNLRNSVSTEFLGLSNCMYIATLKGGLLT